MKIIKNKKKIINKLSSIGTIITLILIRSNQCFAESIGTEVEVTIYSCKSTNGKKCSECVVVASDYGVSCMCQRGESEYCDLHKRQGKF